MKALTANRLDDGEVVFWNAGAWVERFADAELFDDDERRGRRGAGQDARSPCWSIPT